MLKPINKIHASVLKVLQIVKQVFGCGIMLWYGMGCCTLVVHVLSVNKTELLY